MATSPGRLKQRVCRCVCRIVAKVRGYGVIMATIADSDWAVAVDRATTRLGHTVSRRIGRRRDRHVQAHHPVAGALSKPVPR